MSQAGEGQGQGGGTGVGHPCWRAMLCPRSEGAKLVKWRRTERLCRRTERDEKDLNTTSFNSFFEEHS